ncbi:YlbG family protein [Aerococcaceae bacterium zg-ZJ1578]|uniref:YlbG family protein n=1 Tax=Aerococcaceae bacterium zg-252 TaxID=2796928 RepID=UPI001A259385|nr:YlbG family protein [Aerococcaceae bacterium zg-1578]MBS4462680.1 YlbG family protein [Aerococcaceae bacterium zg-B36]
MEKNTIEFNLMERTALVVWLYTLKQLKHIRKFGHVQFVSKRMRYVILYINQADEEETMKKLRRLHFVQKVEKSYRDDIDMTWKDAIPNRKDKDHENHHEDDKQEPNFIQSLVSTLHEKDSDK